MSGQIILLVLGAALLHASWNIIVKGGDNKLFESAMNALGGGLGALCILPFLPVPDKSAWGLLALSCCCHLTYYICIAEAYKVTDLSLGYTIMRGSAPMLTALVLCFMGVPLSLTGWGGVYRQARAKMLSLREEEYVQSMRAFGLSDMVIAYKHMLPNAVGPVVVNLTLSTAMFILDEAAMSFLGLGVPPEIATWGNILNAAQDLYVMQNYWWLWLPVGIVVSLFVISVNCIGDGLRDSTDPTQQG